MNELNDIWHFTKDRSTTQQFVNFVDMVSNNLKQNEHTVSVFLDVGKTFDRVWHEDLLYKMHQMDIPTNLIKLIDSFL